MAILGTAKKLEICCGDLESVKAAVGGGADRIELCSALAVGGLTPSAGMIRSALSMRGSAAIHVLIRTREGDFLYTHDEVEAMLYDIETCRRLGAQGVVIGALRSDGTIDVDVCRRLVAAASGMSITFHRAFDLCNDPLKAIEDIIATGCDRILTSGCAPTATEGIPMLKKLNAISSGRIVILAGSGINPGNAESILTLAGVNELHASARSPMISHMEYRHEGVSMGNPDSDEYTRMTTDASTVTQLANIIHHSK